MYSIMHYVIASVWDAITGYHTVGGLSNRHSFLIILRLGCLMPRYQLAQILVRAFLASGGYHLISS